MDTLSCVVPGTSHDYKEYITQPSITDGNVHIGEKGYPGYPPGQYSDTVDKTKAETERPAHYKTGSIECIDALKDLMSEDEFIGFCRANCIKYLWRYPNKGGVKDLNKAKQYLDWLIEACEAKHKRITGDIK